MIKRDINETSTNSQVNNAVNSKKFKSPIFQQDFDIAKDKLGSMDLVYALVIIRFHCTLKKGPVFRDGKIWAPNIIDRLCYWMCISREVARSILEQFEALEMVETCIYRTGRITSLHVTVIDLKGVPVTFIRLKSMRKAIKMLGGVNESFLFFKIHYHSHDSKVKDGEEKYWVSSADKLAAWAKLSPRTISSILNKFIQNEVIIREKMNWNEHSRSHFRIHPKAIKLFIQMPLEDKLYISPKLVRENCKVLSAKTPNDISNSVLFKEEKRGISSKIPTEINDCKENSYYSSDIFLNLRTEGDFGSDIFEERREKVETCSLKPDNFCRKSFSEAFKERKVQNYG